MRVAVCYTKSGPSGTEICKAFAQGVRRVGDDAVELHSRFQLRTLGAVDALVHVGDVNPHNAYTHTDEAILFRQEAADVCGTNGIRRIVIDTGFLSNRRLMPMTGKPEANRYFSVGYDGTKRNGCYYNNGSPPDRWEQLRLDKQPWRTSGSHILILGQMRFSASTYHLDILEWYVEVARQLRAVTNRPIVLRAHPNQTLLPEFDVPDVRVISNENLGDITADLSNSWCVVARTSNGAIDALVHGIPVVCSDPVCMAFPVCEHELAKVECPRRPDLTNWLCDLAYAQWNIEEMEAGSPWQHLRPHIHKRRALGA